MSCHLIMLNLMTMCIASISLNIEIKDTTNITRSTSYLHLHIDSEDRLITNFKDKRDDFNGPL